MFLTASLSIWAHYQTMNVGIRLLIASRRLLNIQHTHLSHIDALAMMTSKLFTYLGLSEFLFQGSILHDLLQKFWFRPEINLLL